MHPILFEIGGRSIYTYGVVYSLVVLFGGLVSYRLVRREGLNEVHFLTALILAIVGMIIMSKLLHAAINWEKYLERPARFLQLARGHIFYGGYIGAVLFPLLYFKRLKEPFLPYLDVCAFYMPLGLAAHRGLACLGAGCCYGKPTALPWGLTFPANAPASLEYGEVPVHPTQLYEALLGLLIFAVLVWWRKKYRRVPGEIFALQLALYAIGRFIIEFFRGDPVRGVYGPLSLSQWLSIGMLGAAGGLAVFIRQKRKASFSATK